VIDGIKPYPAYKVSALSWLGTIPSQWAETRAKYLFREIDERSVTGREELLSVSHITGVTPRSQKKVTMFMAESTVGHKICHPGDLVINTMWAWMGALGVSPLTGLVSPAYGVYRPSEAGLLLPAFIAYLLRSPHYVNEYVCRSTGIQSSRLRLYPEQLLRIPIVCPPVEEQRLMLRFLAHSDRRIGRHVRAKKMLIELLEEQVASKASDAMRHSSTHLKRLGDVCEQQLHAALPNAAEFYTALGLYNRGRGVFRKPPRIGADLGDSTFFFVKPGDLVISGQFAWEGAVAMTSDSEQGTIVSHRYYLLRGIDGLSTTPYIAALLRSDLGGMLLNHHSRGAAGRNRPLNLRTLLKESVPVPSFEVQRALDEFVLTLLPLRDRIRQQMEKLREYRIRLIADVVTGKLDVREAAAHLPDEPDAPEPLDDADALTDDDAVDPDAAPDEADA
jgi:type I restriction enzyme S subunit